MGAGLSPSTPEGKTKGKPLKVGDLVLLSTEHYNLQLPSHKLAPKWLGPLKVLEIRGPNTVLMEIPLCFALLTQLSERGKPEALSLQPS